jgi:hypothetical protein
MYDRIGAHQKHPITSFMIFITHRDTCCYSTIVPGCDPPTPGRPLEQFLGERSEDLRQAVHSPGESDRVVHGSLFGHYCLCRRVSRERHRLVARADPGGPPRRPQIFNRRHGGTADGHRVPCLLGHHRLTDVGLARIKAKLGWPPTVRAREASRTSRHRLGRSVESGQPEW